MFAESLSHFVQQKFWLLKNFPNHIPYCLGPRGCRHFQLFNGHIFSFSFFFFFVSSILSHFYLQSEVRKN